MCSFGFPPFRSAPSSVVVVVVRGGGGGAAVEVVLNGSKDTQITVKSQTLKGYLNGLFGT